MYFLSMHQKKSSRQYHHKSSESVYFVGEKRPAQLCVNSCLSWILRDDSTRNVYLSLSFTGYTNVLKTFKVDANLVLEVTLQI